MCVFIHGCIHICIYVCTYVCTYTRMYTYMYIYVCIHVCTYMCRCDEASVLRVVGPSQGWPWGLYIGIILWPLRFSDPCLSGSRETLTGAHMRNPGRLVASRGDRAHLGQGRLVCRSCTALRNCRYKLATKGWYMIQAGPGLIVTTQYTRHYLRAVHSSGCTTAHLFWIERHDASCELALRGRS